MCAQKMHMCGGTFVQKIKTAAMKKNTMKKRVNELMQILMSRHTPGLPSANGLFIVNIPRFRQASATPAPAL